MRCLDTTLLGQNQQSYAISLLLLIVSAPTINLGKEHFQVSEEPRCLPSKALKERRP